MRFCTRLAIVVFSVLCAAAAIVDQGSGTFPLALFCGGLAGWHLGALLEGDYID